MSSYYKSYTTQTLHHQKALATKLQNKLNKANFHSTKHKINRIINILLTQIISDLQRVVDYNSKTSLATPQAELKSLIS